MRPKLSEFFKKSLYRRSAPRLVQVVRKEILSPGLLRITFAGEGLADFPEHCPAAHVKLFLPRPEQERPALPSMGSDGAIRWPDGAAKPIVRTYSVRQFRPRDREIDVEFAVHEVEGPATSFAKRAVPGAYAGLSYPGGPDPMLPPAAHYVFVGDLSASPGIASLCDALPPDATGEILLRADDEADIRELRRPAGMQLTWIIASPSEVEPLVAHFRSYQLADNAYYWLGGEHTLVVALRHYLVRERGVPKDALYALPYWRHRFDEEAYHDTREEVMNDGV